MAMLQLRRRRTRWNPPESVLAGNGEWVHHFADVVTHNTGCRPKEADQAKAAETKPAQDCCLGLASETVALGGDAVGFREATMTVRAILDSKGHQVESIQPGAKLSAAVKVLGEKRIGAILVLNMAGHIEGILSERDIVRVLAERGAGVLDEPVSAVMTKKVVICRAADTVAGIMEVMTIGKFRHLPVVEDSKVVGIISIGDIVKWRVREYENEQEALREYIKTA
jgi:CBS domain-containing protein